MRIFMASLFMIVLGLTVFGCGGSQPAAQPAPTSDVPDWYMNPPTDPNFLFAPNSATSQDMQLAIDKSTTGARTEIGRKMEVWVQGLQKKFEEEVGTGDNTQLLSQFTQASKTVVSTTLNGSSVKSQKTVREGNLWRAYVLMQLPIGAAADAFMKTMAKNNNTYTRFRATETFKELDDEVKKYDEFKKSQNQ